MVDYVVGGGTAEPEPDGTGGTDYSAYYTSDAESMVQAAAGGDEDGGGQAQAPAIAAPAVGTGGGSDSDGERVGI